MTTLETRLARLEAAQVAARASDPVADWLAAYRAGADVHSRNASAGAAWCEAAAERQRLALETLVTYGDD